MNASNLCLFMKAFSARGERNIWGLTLIWKLTVIRKENNTLGSTLQYNGMQTFAGTVWKKKSTEKIN